MVGVDPADAIEAAADPLAGADRVVAVVAAARVPSARRDGPADLCTGKGTGVGADAVVAPVARQVGDQAQVILFAGCHTAGIPCARRGQSAVSRPLTALGPQAGLIKLYRDECGEDRPVQGGIKGCWAPDADQARKTMHRLWPNDSIPGESAQLHPLPRHFGQLAQLVTEDMVSARAGPIPSRTSRPSGPTRKPASTRCTWARSAAGSRAPSTSSPPRSCRRCGETDTGSPGRLPVTTPPSTGPPTRTRHPASPVRTLCFRPRSDPSHEVASTTRILSEVCAVGVRSGTGPLHQQQRGVVAQVAGLVVEHRLDQAP